MKGSIKHLALQIEVTEFLHPFPLATNL